MARILNIETSTRMCSVVLAADGHVLAKEESGERNSHAENITLFSEQVLKRSGLTFADLDAVAVSMGPGSYTGLRIGVSTAKGYCYALDIPLIAVGTLEAMAHGMIGGFTGSGDPYFIPMIDARRMEVYTAVFDGQLKLIQPVRAKIIDADSFSELPEDRTLVFAGDGAGKCRQLFQSRRNTLFLDDFMPSATFVAHLAEPRFRQKKFEDVAYFEPFYLKDFVAGIPRVKGLK